MKEIERNSFRTAFHSLEGQLTRLLDFANAVAPTINENPKFLPELADSLVVLTVTRLDGFFIDLVSHGTRHREPAVRRHYAKHGQPAALSCSLPQLVTLVRRRVSFEKDGRRLENVFQLIFKCSVWPSDDVRDLVLDLVLLLNFIIHSKGYDWSQEGLVSDEYVYQFRRARVVDVRKYGEFAVY